MKTDCRFQRPKWKQAIVWMGGSLALTLGVMLLLQTFIAINVSPSLPEWGWFRWPFVTAATDYHRGDRVEFVSPHITDNPIGSVKIIAGLPGDAITVNESGEVRVAGRLIGKALAVSPSGKSFTPVAEGVIPEGYAFMAASHPNSFDSRYASFGLIPLNSIRARVVPLPDIAFLGLDGPLFTEGELARLIEEVRP